VTRKGAAVRRCGASDSLDLIVKCRSVIHRRGVLDGSVVVELLDAQVREEVRRGGVDPLIYTDAVLR
jgi:hypothetical protein